MLERIHSHEEDVDNITDVIADVALASPLRLEIERRGAGWHTRCTAARTR
jgi:hypothetical protein